MRQSPALSPALTHCLRTLSRDLARTRATLEGVKHARGRRARSLALVNVEVDLECADQKLRDVLAVYDEWGCGESLPLPDAPVGVYAKDENDRYWLRSLGDGRRQVGVWRVRDHPTRWTCAECALPNGRHLEGCTTGQGQGVCLMLFDEAGNAQASTGWLEATERIVAVLGNGRTSNDGGDYARALTILTAIWDVDDDA